MNSRLTDTRGHSYSAQSILEFLARPRTLFGLAFVLRLLAIPLAVFRISPYSQADATGFSVVAGILAQRILSGTLSTATRYTDTYEIWSSVLSPFWFLPVGGPVLARIFIAMLGACAVYNAVLIARRLGTPMAGLLTGVPLAVYPSIVLVQSSLLREAAVLFSVTTTARLLLIVSDHGQVPFASSRSRETVALVVLSGGLLAFATLLREYNLPLYVAAIGAGCIAYYSKTWWGKAVAALAVVAGGVGAWVLRELLLGRFNFFRDARARGRTVYLSGVRFDTLLDLISFAPIGAAYFLFTPFPWQIGSVLDVPVMFEGLTNILYAFAGVAGVVVAFKRDRVATIGLLTYFVLGVTFYGLGTANFGTGVRHRQMFSWVLLVFGGVGAHWLWVRYVPLQWKQTVRRLTVV
ncbi:hypothetical protein [Halococcus salsus]|uniref:hypothetical protein n=1 Tax=Halococcus salsus TaxID=2162894 RepID=UPI001357C9D9|nr:hypothetical protein [Halococcus salsus]